MTNIFSNKTHQSIINFQQFQASSEKPEIDYDQIESDCLAKAGITNVELNKIEGDLKSYVNDETAQVK